MLPDLDGMSVCEILRSQPSTTDIPIMMLTALGGQLSRLAGYEAGAAVYLTKPVRPRDLVGHVCALLNRTQPGTL